MSSNVGERVSADLSHHEDSNPIVGSQLPDLISELIISQRPYLLMPSQWGVGFQQVSFAGGIDIQLATIALCFEKHFSK